MHRERVRILFIEDFADDAILIARRLTQLGLNIEHDIVDTTADLVAVLKAQDYDVILCDYNVPGLGANHSLALIREHAPHIPTIIVSGSIGEEQAADLMRAGARDIVIKSNLARLAPAIEREIGARDEHARLATRVDQSERHFTNLVERSFQGIIIRSDFKTLFANEAICRMFGYTLEEMGNIRSMLQLVHPDDHDRVAAHITEQLSQTAANQHFDALGIRKDKTPFWLEVMVSNVAWFGKDAVQIVVIDITERKTAESLLLAREKKYRRLFEDAPVAMFRVNRDRRFVEANRATEILLGYSRAELLLAGPADYIPKEDLATTAFAQLWKGEIDLFEANHRMIRKDGETIWVRNRCSLVEEEGAEPYVLAHLQDITAEKEAEHALAESEQQYRETFEDAPVAMAWIGIDRRFLRTNRACRDLYGYSAEDFSTMHTTDLIDAKYRQAGRLADLVTGKSELATFENRHRRKDGSTIWVLTNMALIRGKDGAAEFLLAHLQDITARKTAEDQLFHAVKMEAVGNLAGGIAHDFNNMLVPIIGLTDFMKDELPSDSPLQENLDLVLDAAIKARDLVRQILTFSRQDEMVVTAIKISTWMREALGLLRNLVPTTITIVESFQPGVGTIMADSAQLQSIIMNLGSNAVAAIGGKVGELRVGLARVQIESVRTPATAGLARGAYARISVGDSGKGMDTTTLAKIFDPFFTTKAPGEGTGLGLSMVHGIVERYGGAIDVTSRIGVGTRFDIYLPLVDTASDAERII